MPSTRLRSLANSASYCLSAAEVAEESLLGSGRVGPWTGREITAVLVASLTASLAPLISLSLTRSPLANAHLYEVDADAVSCDRSAPW